MIHKIYSSEAVGCGIFARFLNFDNCQPEVYSDVISGVVVAPKDVKVPVKMVTLGQTVLETYDCLTLLRTTTTTTADGPYDGVLPKTNSSRQN